MKKLLTLLISLSLVINPSIVLAESKCNLESSLEFGGVGDVSGKRIFTKEEYEYECLESIIKKGSCKKTKEIQHDANASSKPIVPIYFETDDFSGSMGKMMGIVQAYDKIDGLWSGWTGICQRGVDDGAFDWASDPMVLAGYAITMASASYTGGSAGNGVETSIAKQAAQESSDRILKYALCAAEAGLSTASILNELNSDGIPCNPTDEFCEDEESGDQTGMIYSIPSDELNEFIVNNPDALEYIEIINGEGTNAVTIRITPPSSSMNGDTSQEAKRKIKELKEVIAAIRAAIMAIQLTSCLLKNTGASGGNTNKDEDPLGAKNLLLQGISAYNPLVGMGISIAMNTAESLSKINTCSSRNDAEDKGDRHTATFDSKEAGLCHATRFKKSGGVLTPRKKFYYCCYDNKITRILVEQVKAQYLKNWNSCTDITIAELKNVSFKSCDPIALDAGINGVHLSFDATVEERKSAYQYTNNCIDTREYVDYMIDTFAGEDLLIDTSLIEEKLEDLR